MKKGLYKNIIITAILYFAHMEHCLSGDNPFGLADSLKQAGLYEYAAIEYERVYFNSEAEHLRASALLHKAECLKVLKRFDQAEKCLLRINYSGLPDTSAFVARYQTALCAYLAGHYTNAESQLLQIEYYTRDTLAAKQSLLLFAFVLNELQKWDEAESRIREWIDYAGPVAAKDRTRIKFDLLYNRNLRPVLKNAEKAKLLSMIIPGSGFIYAGYPGEGILNAAFQGCSLLLTAYGIYSGYYVTAAIVPLSIFQRFYGGAINRLEFLVNKKNFELTQRYNMILKKEILSLGAGAK